MLELIPAAAYREALWKNGGGLSYEIAADASTPPAWRISVARINRAGPFSDYRGYDRTILALGGAGVELEVNGERIPLVPLHPYAFAGEARVHAHTRGGAARDLNVMTMRDELLHDVEIVEASARFVLEDDEFAFVYAIDGATRVDEQGCAAGDTVAIGECESFDVSPELGAHAAVIRITPV